MNRRELLKLLSMGVIGYELDIDQLLWIPGQKTIFLPSTGISYADMVSLELKRMAPKLRALFDRDSPFYSYLNVKL